VNILVVPGTTLLAKEICHSVAFTKGVFLYGAGLDQSKSFDYPYLGFDFLDSWSEDTSIEDLEIIVNSRKIDYLYLAHDSWILGLQELDNIGGAKIIKSTSYSIGVTSYKSLTYKSLRNMIPTPKIFENIEEVMAWPIFVKPDRGQGSRDCHLIENVDEIVNLVDVFGNFKKEWVACEYLPGFEYTIDCFSDMRSQLLYASARIRKSVDSGIALATQILPNYLALEWAQTISSSLHITGAWFFQVKEDVGGHPKLMEVGVRIAGASGVLRLKGINLSLLNLFQIRGYDLQIIDHPVLTATQYSHYELGFLFNEVYVDYDDTLIVNSKLNSNLMQFLKMAKREGKKITLITRHSGNLETSIAKYELRGLFENVVHLKLGELKSDFIFSRENFVFIDDSFKERLEVWHVFGDHVLTLDETAFER
jgi:hypothetical protein